MTSPKLATTTNNGRMYTHPTTGKQYPSVTTVLNVVGKGDALKHWAAKIVATYAVEQKDTWLQLDNEAAIDLLKREPMRSLDRASNRGTDVHAIAESYSRTGTLPVWADALGGYIEALQSFFTEHQPQPVMIEQTVFNDEIGYAGSFDMVCRLPAFGDALVILDYKTSKAIYPEVGAQLAAYAHATTCIDDTGKDTPMPKIDRGVAVRFAADGVYEVIECDIVKGWEYFKQVRGLHRLVAKELIIGKVLTPQIDPTESATKKTALRERLAHIKTTSPAAVTALLAAWSPAMPTLKSDHQHTTHQLAEIEKLLNRIEGDHSVSFPQLTVKRPPARKTKTPVEVAKLPSETLLVDAVTVDALRERLENTDAKTKETARAIAKQAAAVQRSISLSGKPSLRRLLLIEFMIEAIEESEGTDQLIDVIIQHCRLDQPNTTIGAILGNLDLDQITKMSTALTQIREGAAAVTYNSNTNTYTYNTKEATT